MRLRVLTKKTSIKGKRILLRVNLNAPIQGHKLEQSGMWRIKRALPIINYLSLKKAKVILLAHLGRPQGKPKSYLTLKSFVPFLTHFLKRKVFFINQTTGRQVQDKVENLLPGDIILLENVRFNKGEEENSKAFARKLANFADVYINEAFGDSHRNHASINAITSFLPSYAGWLFAEEVATLTNLKNEPKKPLVVIIGGAKIETKIGIMRGFLPFARFILLGGGVANTLLKARGFNIGKSLHQQLPKKVLKSIMRSTKIILPEEVIVKRAKQIFALSTSQIEPNDCIIDISPKMVFTYIKLMESARTVIWNGPLGIIETNAGGASSKILVRALAKSKASTFVGGGETVTLLTELKIINRFSFVSTGGGAMLALLAGEKLPGIEALRSR